MPSVPDTSPAATPAAMPPAAPTSTSTSSVPAEGGNDDEEPAAVWGKYSIDDQAAGIAREYALAKHPYKALHKVTMEVDLFLDLAGIRHYTKACK
jgi:hypothetical protein